MLESFTVQGWMAPETGLCGSALSIWAMVDEENELGRWSVLSGKLVAGLIGASEVTVRHSVSRMVDSGLLERRGKRGKYPKGFEYATVRAYWRPHRGIRGVRTTFADGWMRGFLPGCTFGEVEAYAMVYNANANGAYARMEPSDDLEALMGKRRVFACGDGLYACVGPEGAFGGLREPPFPSCCNSSKNMLQ